MNYGNKAVGGTTLVATGIVVYQLWIVAGIIIALAFGTILYRHKTRRIK